ncbi:hypothetical protein AU184_07130 [Mycolicibacterium novocastrense]|uniref:hypothetical protein n=1 Tax=Mycolicibacterium novocastrense TaxID=59813 RepID=UPI0007482A7A|nr:hypothetical protein AU183_25050 [Mycolicibacterium novocastrense]KUH74727.1 hypothetical protein AU072_12120 [Mycolicibacterium novocastrense]KUH76041.1 hypothetical protein AU184_07130 [Mycolicibacterium novocastrense]
MSATAVSVVSTTGRVDDSVGRQFTEDERRGVEALSRRWFRDPIHRDHDIRAGVGGDPLQLEPSAAST